MFIPDGSATCHYCGSSVAPQYPAAQQYPAGPQYQQAPAAPYGYNPQMAAYPTAGYQPAYGMPPPMMAYPMYPMMRPRTGTPTAAGVMLLIGGILGLMTPVFMLGLGSMLFFIPLYGSIFIVCFVLILIFAVFALIGGVMAMQRKSWALALIGAIFCMFCIGPIYISSILGLIGLILVVISKDEFV
jgi:hypothetical protein